VLAGQYQAYNFIVQMIAIEVSDADEESTLFHLNSAVAKLFTMYMWMTSLRYLWQVLVLTMHLLNDNAHNNDSKHMYCCAHITDPQQLLLTSFVIVVVGGPCVAQLLHAVGWDK
jgi:hypothetical protein